MFDPTLGREREREKEEGKVQGSLTHETSCRGIATWIDGLARWYSFSDVHDEVRTKHEVARVAVDGGTSAAVTWECAAPASERPELGSMTIC
jgi:hypothetical protein